MEAQITLSQELFDARQGNLDKFDAKVSKWLEEEHRRNAEELAEARKALHATYASARNRAATVTPRRSGSSRSR
jgi:multidrug resistance efflux pump